MIIDANLYEPIRIGVTADALQPTVDALQPTADGGLLVGATETTDAVVNANFISAEIYEPVRTGATADSLQPTVDALAPTADGGILEGATDQFDAEVISISVPAVGGGIYRPRKPLPVIGVGFGELPQLEGEAYGTVGVAGRSAAQILVCAAAVGQHGQAGAAIGTFKDLSIASKGVAGTRGAGSGVIAIELNATAIGRHDDDEAAVMTFLLAA